MKQGSSSKGQKRTRKLQKIREMSSWPANDGSWVGTLQNPSEDKDTPSNLALEFLKLVKAFSTTAW